MKRKLFVVFVLSLGFGLNLLAQERQLHFSKEEFREKQQAYIARKANLTQEEAEQFFVLFFELQDKKQKLNKKIGNLIRETKHQ